MKSRRAYTLIELSVCMTAGVTLLVMCVTLLHQSMQLAKVEKGRAEQQRRADRLASEFRRDVHHASEVELVSPQHIQLQGRSQMTSYQVTGSLVKKRRSSDGQLTQSDTFELGPDSSVVFESLRSPSRIQMKVSSGNRVNQSRRTDRNVSAVLGRFPTELVVEESR